MNTIVKLGVASALAFGAVSANASITQPSTGSSDLILFAEVLNSSGGVVASYAGDTTVSTPAASGGVATKLTNSSDTALAALFAADGSGDSIVYAVQGGYYGGTDTAPKFKTTGYANFATTTANAAALAGTTAGGLVTWANIGNTISTLNTNFTGAGGTGSSVEGSNPATAGVWDQVTTPTGIYSWFTSGPVTAVTLGTAQTLYGVTGGGTTTGPVTVSTLGTVQLSSAGLQFTAAGGGAPVPIPAAVWLLGSGLLGLAGVGRRKLKSVNA